MNFSALSIRHPLVAIVFFVLLTIGGWIGFEQMKVQQFPDIDFPLVVVTVTMPGASPDELENDIAKKVEAQLNTIAGIKHISSVLQTGVSTSVAEFTLEKPLQEAVDDVRSAVDEMGDELPTEANQPIVSKVSTAGFPAATYTVSGPNMRPEDLTWLVDDRIAKRLSKIPGLGKIERVGGLDREIRVTPDPQALAAANLSIAQLSDQISAQQENVSAGEAAVGSEKQNMRVLGAIQRADQLGQIQLALPSGGFHLLQDLAEIRDTTADASSLAFLNGEPVVAFNVIRSRGASEVALVDMVGAELAMMEKEIPGLQIEKVYDRAKPIDENYRSSLKMLIEGGILAVIVVFLFLRDLRATLVAAVALPLSIIPTFLGMSLFGFSLNLISLLALSLVVGVLVDDAIVEIENIMRHLQRGKSPMAAATEAADEIGLAVIATTFTLIAVFLPTAFMSGVVGQFFRQFGWTAVMAIFFSLLVARLITPMMSAYLLKAPAQKVEKPDSLWMRAYLQTVKRLISWRWLTMAVTIAAFALSLLLTRQLPSDFIPVDNSDQSRVRIELPAGATLEETQVVAEKVRALLVQHPAVVDVFSSIGAAGEEMSRGSMNSGSSPNMAVLDLVFSPRGTRPEKRKLEQEIRKEIQSVPGAQFSVGLSDGGKSGYTFTLTGDNPAVLNQTALAVIQAVRQLPNAGSVNSNRSVSKNEWQILPDRLKMADAGVTTTTLARTLRIATQGDYEQFLSKLDLESRQIPVVVRLSDDLRGDLAQLHDLEVATGQSTVRLGDVAEIRLGGGPATIQRYDQSRQIEINVAVREGVQGELIDAVKALPVLDNLPPGVSFVNTGSAENQKELFDGFVLAMGVGVLCIYCVLVLLFHRLLQPLTILVALPLSAGGAFAGLLLTDSSLSMPSLIGLIMLMGIATKNSILLVDYALIASDRDGLPRTEALLDACHKRARPIIMTTIAMGAGMLPLLIGWGNQDISFRQPMAAAVLGGLITSTFLSLIVIPVFYTFMDDLTRWFRRVFMHKHDPAIHGV